MANIASDSLVATGGGTPITIQKGWLLLRGTWVGTVNLQTGPNSDGTWSNMTDGSGNVIAFTGNVNCPIDNSVPMNMRVYITWTSGTLVSTLSSQNPF